jgi:hypothetical protein
VAFVGGSEDIGRCTLLDLQTQDLASAEGKRNVGVRVRTLKRAFELLKSFCQRRRGKDVQL